MKAKVLRGVYIRGTPHPEGAIVEVTPHEYAELRTYNYLGPVPAVLETSKPEPAAARPILSVEKVGKTG